jgi:hypothetical protein
MAYERMAEGSLDYSPYRYGSSRLLFRGPRRRLEGEFITVLGGTETYGRFIEKPYPALIEAATGMQMVNFGCVNAGVDVFLNDSEVLAACRKARATVVQILGAQNMTNRYYAVHPRRNDRFLRASPLMKTIFREVDFTEFNFTGHMLSTLQRISPEKFSILAEELKAAWMARMRLLLARLGSRTVLLWMADHKPAAEGDPLSLDEDPLLVDRAMIEAISVQANAYVEVVSSAAARDQGREGMVVAPYDAAAAAGLPGPVAHDEVAKALAPLLLELA